MAEQKKYIVAGSYAQFCAWCHEFNMDPLAVSYISRSDQLRGLDFTANQIIKVGTYYRREDIEEINRIIQCSTNQGDRR